MNQALRPQPQLGEVLPGALTLGLFLLWVYDCFPDKLDLFWGSNTNAALLVILAGGFLFASWITGTILDSIRNLITEGIVDCCSEEKINWDFLFTDDKDKVFQLDEYYQAKSNYAIGLIIFLLYSTISACILHWNRLTAITCVIAIITFGICLFDARSLRNEIKRLVRVAPELLDQTAPDSVHRGVYTRLKQSEHGVGVFAIRDIPEGTNIFEGDINELRQVDKADIDLGVLDSEISKLYEDFCVWRGNKIFVPTSFNNLTPGWYLNHSLDPNTKCDDDSISSHYVGFPKAKR
jgi:hypothetical protein